MCGCASEQKQLPTIYKAKIDNKYNKFVDLVHQGEVCSDLVLSSYEYLGRPCRDINDHK